MTESKVCLFVGGVANGRRQLVEVSRDIVEVRAAMQWERAPASFEAGQIEPEYRQRYVAHVFHTDQKTVRIFALESLTAGDVLGMLIDAYPKERRT